MSVDGKDFSMDGSIAVGVGEVEGFIVFEFSFFYAVEFVF